MKNYREPDKKTYWIIYEKPHKYRGGKIHMRKDVKTLTLPKNAFNIHWNQVPKTRRNKQGNKVYGVEVEYQKKVNTRGGGETLKDYSRIVQIPEDVEKVYVSKYPPKRERRR